MLYGHGLGEVRDFTRSNTLQRILHEMVPGGAHTYARGPDQYPEGMAPIVMRGRGCRVQDCGALLVFDEMITGFRWATGGAQETYGVVPDLSCWGNATSRGRSPGRR
ncbi:hypothetical protein ACIP5Y_23430 [Nocardia sp. NPDC088792]|uniref:hypothetical protein n=1 Tax=Nocardia sp. NPDC088792 TaxID=3364332 RepID=UPI00382D43C9